MRFAASLAAYGPPARVSNKQILSRIACFFETRVPARSADVSKKQDSPTWFVGLWDMR